MATWITSLRAPLKRINLIIDSFLIPVLARLALANGFDPEIEDMLSYMKPQSGLPKLPYGWQPIVHYLPSKNHEVDFAQSLSCIPTLGSVRILHTVDGPTCGYHKVTLPILDSTMTIDPVRHEGAPREIQCTENVKRKDTFVDMIMAEGRLQTMVSQYIKEDRERRAGGCGPCDHW